MATTGNAPCNVTRVIEATALRIANQAKMLESHATIRENSSDGVLGRELREAAKELRQCAYQLTGKAY